MTPLAPVRRRNARRRTLGILAWLLAAPALAGPAGPPALPLAANFTADAATARERGVPILVLYSRPGCPWCERARQELLPLAADPAALRRVLIREVVLGSDAPLADFGGRAGTHAGFADARGVKLVPTLDFLDERGNRLADALIGVGVADYYGAMIERAIDESLARLHATVTPK